MDKKTIKINDVKITEVSSLYDNPFPALALCWYDNGKKGLFYDNVPASFSRHPCDLFVKNGKREAWKPLERYGKEIIEFLLPADASYLHKNIAGSLEVSDFGRVGISINNESCNGCEGCSLKNKCKKFHYILPQREKCSWNEGYWERFYNIYISKQEFEMYNGWLVVDINGREEFVYRLVAEAFKMKEKTREELEKENSDLITYINKISLGIATTELEEAIKKIKNGENVPLEIHHIKNNGHHNTPTYWDENSKMIEGNLIALPEKVHQKIHGKS